MGFIFLYVSIYLKAQETTIELTGKRSTLANSDGNYRALRDGSVTDYYHLENLELKRDAGVLTMRDGVVGFLPAVLGRVTAAVFVGNGRFQLNPMADMERDYLRKFSGAEAVDEEFTTAVLYFTDDTADEIVKQGKKSPAPAGGNPLNDLRKKLRRQQESPRSILELFLSGEDIQNIEAEMLAELYNPRQGGSFRAYLHGKRDSDLRFMVVPQGAMPMLPSPEEVAVVNVDPGGEREGIWYLTHRKEEWEKGQINSSENKRSVAAQNYRIETAIARGGRLTATAEVTFAAAIDGVRVVHFGLLPALRVSRVTKENREIAFIQEDRKEDGSFYVVLPEALAAGKSATLHIEYEGNKVLRDEGGGNYSVGARTSWYPSLNSFLDRATYDLTFRVPKQNTLVSVGKMVKRWEEKDAEASEWKSDIPLAVAGFNYGRFKEKELTDPVTKYEVEAYATSEVPGYLREATDGATFTPSALANSAAVNAQNAIRLFEKWFGACPYGRVAISQQPQFDFGQSWPTLVYLPVSAFLDSTQRWMLLDKDASKFSQFILEVTPHEVAHQWWGHMVGWSSYRDQWLSEGFAEFSAGLFLEASEKRDQVDKFWSRLRDRVVQKNNFGNTAGDSGPIWMGIRLDTFKNPSAYNRLVYAKGAYILHMLRMLMWDEKNGDQDFIAMMHDFVETYMHRNATSESFRAIVEKHMKPVLDVQGNHTMDWFYSSWVYGTDIPKYRLEYSLAPSSGGKVAFTGKLTQSGVSQGFTMRVPIYFDFDGHLVRAGSMPMRGNSTSNEIKIDLPKKPKRVLLNAHNDVLAADAVVKEN
jgi:hypothetical protein